LLKHNSHRNHQWGGEHQNNWQVSTSDVFLFVEGFSFFRRSFKNIKYQDMERKEFLKTIGMFGLMPLVAACKENEVTPSNATSNGNSTSGTCTSTVTETAGPFPTKDPASFVRADIRGDRTGILLNVTITIQNKNNNCAPLTGVLVDIWHCDKDGNYSEYGGTGMQSTNYTTNHFLRGRQSTDSNGKVGFTTIFPGWYTGRATHIHVHVYTATGNSLLVTQIAFPEGTNSAVNLVNASAANGYTKGMSGYTPNSNDNVFSDGVSTELANVLGNVVEGFALTHTIVVSA
jgi:protocatechuate 3,4-dioxygenase beta subunit